MLDLRRREFITVFGGAAVAWPLVARAQQSTMPVIGTLYSVSAAEWQENMAGFRRGLGDADALLVLPSTLFFNARKHITDLATEHRLPSMSPLREFATDDGLAAYGDADTDGRVRQRPLFQWLRA
jgi:hypothetical protein